MWCVTPGSPSALQFGRKVASKESTKWLPLLREYGTYDSQDQALALVVRSKSQNLFPLRSEGGGGAPVAKWNLIHGASRMQPLWIFVILIESSKESKECSTGDPLREISHLLGCGAQ